MRVERRQSFVDDLLDAYSWIAVDNPRAADHLFDQVDEVVRLIADFPKIGRVRAEFGENLRSHPVSHFPYVAFYRLQPNLVSFIRLIHGARDLEEMSFDQ